MRKTTFWLAMASIVYYIACGFRLANIVIIEYHFAEFLALILSFGPLLLTIVTKMEMPKEKTGTRIFKGIIIANIVLFFGFVCTLAVFNDNYENLVFPFASAVCFYNMAMVLIVNFFFVPKIPKVKTALE